MKLPWQNKVWLIDWPWGIWSCCKKMTNAWGKGGYWLSHKNLYVGSNNSHLKVHLYNFFYKEQKINALRFDQQWPHEHRVLCLCRDLPHGPMSISMLQHISYNIFCFLLTGVILRNSKEFRFALPFKLFHNNTWFKLNLTDMWAEKLNKFNSNTHQNLHFSNNLLIQMLRNVLWDSTGHQQKYKTIPS